MVMNGIIKVTSAVSLNERGENGTERHIRKNHQSEVKE